MKRFIRDIRKYARYCFFSARASLKAEVAASYLNWLWWILDPLAFMLIYMFIVRVVFKSNEPNFPIFVFIGLTIWNFFNKCLTASVKLIRDNKMLVVKVYVPKFIIVIEKMLVSFFKMLISTALIVVMLVIFRVPFTWRMLSFIPILLLLWVGTFGLSCILTHFSVYVGDMTNLIAIILRLMFYMSGIFYSIPTRLDASYSQILLKVNPVGLLIDAARNALLLDAPLDWLALALWLGISLLASWWGVHLIYKYENSYAKVI